MIRPARRVLEAIRQGKVAPGYALAGPELYWRDHIWAALGASLGGETGSAITEFDLRHCSAETIVAAADENSLWAPRQLLLARNAQLLTAARGLPVVAEYFRRPSPGAICVFEMTGLDPQAEDWREREKAKERLEEWAGFCEVALLSRPSVSECVEVIHQEASARGRNISREGAERLAALLDGALARIVNELEKLCLQHPDALEITPEEVCASVGQGAPAAQPLSEALGSRRPENTLRALAGAIRQGAYPPLLVSELARYLRQLLVLREARPRDARNAARVLSAAKLPAPQNALPEMMRQAQASSIEHLADCLCLAAQADLALRSSPPDPRLVLEQLALRIMTPA